MAYLVDSVLQDEAMRNRELELMSKREEMLAHKVRKTGAGICDCQPWNLFVRHGSSVCVNSETASSYCSGMQMREHSLCCTTICGLQN